MVSLVCRKTGNGPLNVVLERLPRGARRLRITGPGIYVDDNRLEAEPGKRYDSAVPRLPAKPARLKKNLRFLRDFLGRNARPESMCGLFSPSPEASFRTMFGRGLLERMKKGAALIEDGNYSAGARSLRGLGFGLTPSGDDFLCGLLTGMSFIEANLPVKLSSARKSVCANAVTGNFISATFLHCACEGRVSEKTGKLLTALAGFDKARLVAEAEGSLRTGHTSGADFCAGLIYGCEAGLRAAQQTSS